VHHPSLFVEIANSMSYLENHMTRKVLAEISELDNLVK
jgi:hypothetical protein